MSMEKKLNVGEWFGFPDLKALGGFTGVVSQGVVDLTISDSAKQKGGSTPGRVRSSAAGSNAVKTHRNYRWVPWATGAVNYAEAQGMDVLSGSFSGCYMIRYKEAGGSWRVAHVSTGDGTDARGDWNTLAAQPGFQISHGFKPYDIGRDQGLHANMTGAFRFLGLITSTGDCWHFIVSPEPWDFDNARATPMRKILYRKKLPSLSQAALQNLA